MPINKETIISVFNDKLTLEQWLKTINKALDEAVLTGVEINKKGNATLSFKFTFEDGTFLETNDLVLQQGESVSNAYIQNGHLYLTLTNGTNLDAGNVKPVSSFSIDASQHLIVNYADGTTQDLGAIFNGNISINGWLEQSDFNYLSNNQTISPQWLNGITAKNVYMRFGVINKVLYVVVSAQLENETENDITTNAGYPLFNSAIPSSIASKIYRKDGTTCNVQATDTNGDICLIDLILSRRSGVELNRKTALIYSVNATQFAIWLANASFTVPAGATYDLDARTFLLL